jgi:hypothetical protein
MIVSILSIIHSGKDKQTRDTQYITERLIVQLGATIVSTTFLILIVSIRSGIHCDYGVVSILQQHQLWKLLTHKGHTAHYSIGAPRPLGPS